MQSRTALFAAAMLMLLAACPTFAGNGAAVSVTIDNYAKSPIHATAVAIDYASLCDRLGIQPGAPIAFTDQDRKTMVPALLGKVGEHAVVRLFVSLTPHSQHTLLAMPADHWTAIQNVASARYDVKQRQGRMTNGILEVTFTPKGWSLGFAEDGTSSQQAEDQSIMKHGVLDCWIDHTNRGRMIGVNPRDKGLLPAQNARIVDRKVAVTPDGGVTLTLTRRFGGFAKQLRMVESFALPAGSSTLVYRVRWDNQGTSPLWVAYTGTGGGILADWGELMAPPLMRRTKSPLGGDLVGSVSKRLRLAWQVPHMRVGVQSRRSGCGLAISMLHQIPKKLKQGAMVWDISNANVKLNFVDPKQGQFPFEIKPGQAIEEGLAFAVTQADANVLPTADALWQGVTADKTPALPSACAAFLDGKAMTAQPVTAFTHRFDSHDAAPSANTTWQAALTVNLDQPTLVKLDIAKADAARPVELLASPPDAKSKSIVLLEATEPGTHTVELAKATTWHGEASLVLSLRADSAPAIRSISLAPAPAAPVRLLSPMPDMEITPLAAMFRWDAATGAINYQLQLAHNKSFDHAKTVHVQCSYEYPWYLPSDNALPAPGTWYWRVRAVRDILTSM